MNHWSRHKTLIASVSLSALLVYAICIAFNQMSAAMHYYKAKNRLDNWVAQGKVTNEAAYQEGKSAAESAVSLSNTNPLYLDILADVYQWGLYQQLEPDSADVTKRAQALYHKSLQYRPGWPVTWANLALLKWRMKELDNEFRFYLERADTLGISQPEVHLLFTELGFATYQARHPLYTEYQAKIKHRLYQALLTPQSREKAIALIEKYEMKKTACRWLQREHKGFVLQIANC